MENVDNYLLFVPKFYFALPIIFKVNHFIRLKVIFPMYIYEKYSSISILKKQSELQEETPKND